MPGPEPDAALAVSKRHFCLPVAASRPTTPPRNEYAMPATCSSPDAMPTTTRFASGMKTGELHKCASGCGSTDCDHWILPVVRSSACTEPLSSETKTCVAVTAGDESIKSGKV